MRPEPSANLTDCHLYRPISTQLLTNTPTSTGRNSIERPERMRFIFQFIPFIHPYRPEPGLHPLGPLISTGPKEDPKLSTTAPPTPGARPRIPQPTPPLRCCRWESVSLNKSRPRRADAQWLVTTRLLDHVHDPLAQLGRLQRIRPRASLNDNPSASWGCFSTPPVADLFRYRARRPIRIQLRRAGANHRVPARILT